MDLWLTVIGYESREKSAPDGAFVADFRVMLVPNMAFEVRLTHGRIRTVKIKVTIVNGHTERVLASPLLHTRI